MTQTQQTRYIPEIGDRVRGADHLGADAPDTGRVVDTRGGEALVAWATGVRTWTPVGDLIAA